MAGLRGTGRFLVIALIPWMAAGCASTSSRLAKLHHSSADSQDQLWTHAQLSEHEGRFAAAQQQYAELCRLDPKSSIYAHRLGVVSTMLSDHERAQSAYARARELDPNNPDLLADMGYAAYLRKDYVQAETLLKASLASVADNPRAKSNLALAIGCQGRYDESVALFRDVHGQDEAEVLCNLAYVKSQRGEVVEATKIYKQVLSIDPKFVKAATALAQLKSADAPGQAVAQQKPYHKYMQKAPVIPAKSSVAEVPIATSPVTEPMVADAPVVEAAMPTPTEEFDAFEAVVVQTADQVVQEVELDDPSPWTEEEPDLKSVPAPVPTPVTAEATEEAQPPVQITPAPQRVRIKALITAEEPAAAVEEKVEETSVSAQAVLEPAATDDAPRELTDAWTSAQTGISEQFGPEWLSTREAQIQARSGQSGYMGFCPVTLRDEMKLVDAMPQYTVEYQFQRLQFSSEEAMQKFLAKPERYLPAAGGLDVVAVSQGTAVAQGSLEHALWFRKKLYLFLNRENMETFRTQAREFAVQE